MNFQNSLAMPTIALESIQLWQMNEVAHENEGYTNPGQGHGMHG